MLQRKDDNYKQSQTSSNGNAFCNSHQGEKFFVAFGGVCTFRQENCIDHSMRYIMVSWQIRFLDASVLAWQTINNQFSPTSAFTWHCLIYIYIMSYTCFQSHSFGHEYKYSFFRTLCIQKTLYHLLEIYQIHAVDAVQSVDHFQFCEDYMRGCLLFYGQIYGILRNKCYDFYFRAMLFCVSFGQF